jgi:hypothetical protein
MRLIKLALISFVFLFLVVTGISLFIPSHIRISRATNLLADKDSIFILITDSSRWKNWNPIFQPNGKIQPGSIQLERLEQSDSIVRIEYSQAGRRPLMNSWQLHEYTHTDSVTLQWYMDFNLKWYPWEKFRSLFYEKTYGSMMETGLNNIKTRVE